MSAMPGRGRGKRLTDSERMEIIARLEDPGTQLSRAMCARQYGVSPAAISKLMKGSHAVKKRYSDAGVARRDKRQRGGFCKNVAFEDELFQWICSVRARKVPLLVAHVQQKAKLLASRHKMSDAFKASNGWYYRFCGRYGLTPASLHAGAPAVEGQNGTVEQHSKSDKVESTQWTKVRDKAAQFGPEFVYSVSEARLFYQTLPRELTPKTGTSAGTAATTGAMPAPGKTARVLVLVCTNGTGTHKIPLLVVGKERVPACLAALRPELLQGDISSKAKIYTGVGMGAAYFSQREIWCDDRTFKHWCERVFLPAVRQRTTQPVLLVAENPGGRLAAFEQENVSTIFLPLRADSEVSLLSQQQTQPGAIGLTNAGVTSPGQFQSLHGAVIRDLKRRYKIGLFLERLSFLETPTEEKVRLVQRGNKKPGGSAGVALGQEPNLIDAMSLLDEAWAATPPALIRSCWVKSSLTTRALLSSPVPIASPELSDDDIVLELCSMLRNTNLADDMNKLAKNLRHWLYVDDDSSEQMQQELLFDIQQLLQEEEQQGCGKLVAQDQQQTQFQLQQQQSATGFIDSSGMPAAFDTSQPGPYGYHSNDDRPEPVPALDPDAVLEEKRNSVTLALRALAEAEEALDNADVADFFGEEAAGHATENVSRAIRRLRRIQRGKRSALVAVAVNAAASGDANGSTSGALSTHEYFYGNGARGRIS
uniref:HTH CENPB-type domain-containing protein n=1 Tax=Phytophthora ramorum TaxID=164328 RepID=H3H0U0_PHYRM